MCNEGQVLSSETGKGNAYSVEQRSIFQKKKKKGRGITKQRIGRGKFESITKRGTFRHKEGNGRETKNANPIRKNGKSAF